MVDARRNLQRSLQGSCDLTSPIGNSALAEACTHNDAIAALSDRNAKHPHIFASPRRNQAILQKRDERRQRHQSDGAVLHNQETNLDATMSRNNVDEMLSSKAMAKSASAIKQSLAVGNLDQLYERAVWGWAKPDRDGETTLEGLHRFFAPMVYEGRAYLTKMTVKKTTGPLEPNPMYTVEAVEFQTDGDAVRWVTETARADGFELKLPDRGSSLPATARDTDIKHLSDAPDELSRTTTWVIAADAI